MNILYKALILLILFVGIMSCGSSRKALEEALAQAKKDSIALAKLKEKSADKLEQVKIAPIQRKYAVVMGVEAQTINIPLFKFIDKWIETPYKMGGETKSGIDCSFFAQYLFHDVYGNLIERTAQKQFDAPSTSKFLGQKYLVEGDLLFFNLEGSEFMPITHVGVYLGNGRFVHSTARRAANGKNGVQISNLKSQHWQKLFVAAGRKPNPIRNIEN
ncbi:hypothetical protein GCM10022393_32170 [Aquimarina addita]|uniref:NlpC/P60 domain-containing protein n=1 Tax=Aquimarina addita TaxID=870485 RepID=A0ABP6US01_9FLAO